MANTLLSPKMMSNGVDFWNVFTSDGVICELDPSHMPYCTSSILDGISWMCLPFVQVQYDFGLYLNQQV
jgi:hypothetical protein